MPIFGRRKYNEHRPYLLAQQWLLAYRLLVVSDPRFRLQQLQPTSPLRETRRRKNEVIGESPP